MDGWGELTFLTLLVPCGFRRDRATLTRWMRGKSGRYQNHILVGVTGLHSTLFSIMLLAGWAGNTLHRPEA